MPYIISDCVFCILVSQYVDDDDDYFAVCIRTLKLYIVWLWVYIVYIAVYVWQLSWILYNFLG